MSEHSAEQVQGHPMSTDDSTRTAEQEAQGRRLLAHIFAPKTTWSRLSSRLLDFGRRGVPDARDSRNPVKWLAGEFGWRMQDATTRRINRRFDREEARRG